MSTEEDACVLPDTIYFMSSGTGSTAIFLSTFPRRQKTSKGHIVIRSDMPVHRICTCQIPES